MASPRESCPATYDAAPAVLAAAAHAQPTRDLRAWIDEVGAATAGGACDGPFGACLAQAEALDAAVGWSAGCTEEVGRAGDRSPGWGTVEVTWRSPDEALARRGARPTRRSPDEALASLGCAFWGDQGGSVVLHVASERGAWRRRLRAPERPRLRAGRVAGPARGAGT